MNYCEHHLGDYAKRTGAFSMLEHGAYAKLRDRYFVTEAPIPDADVYRQAGARSKEERAAVDVVLAEFYELDDAGWRCAQFDAEIEKTRAKIEAARANGKKGGRPKPTQKEPTGLAAGNPSGIPEESSPLPSTHTPLSPPGGGQTVPCPYVEIVDSYHARLPELPKVKLMPESRQKALRKFWGWVLSSTKSDGTRRAETGEQALEWIGAYFARAAENDFLMGRTPRSAEHKDWRCDLDFLLTDRGKKQVIEKTQEAA